MHHCMLQTQQSRGSGDALSPMMTGQAAATSACAASSSQLATMDSLTNPMRSGVPQSTSAAALAASQSVTAADRLAQEVAAMAGTAMFADTYVLSPHIIRAGKSVVAFARDRSGDAAQVAIKCALDHSHPMLCTKCVWYVGNGEFQGKGLPPFLPRSG